MLNRLNNFIDPKNLEMHIYTNGIYVTNYGLISSFSDNKIELKNKIVITFIGKNLVISKLTSNELFISGEVYEIKRKYD